MQAGALILRQALHEKLGEMLPGPKHINQSEGHERADPSEAKSESQMLKKMA